MASGSSLYLFSLPSALLNTLTLRNAPAEPAPPPTGPQFQASVPSSGGRSCALCLGTTFIDLDDQRAHFRSDWHRYNVKARLSNGKTVSEMDFANMIDGLGESLSGSASSSDEESSSSEDAVNTLIGKGSQDSSHLDTPIAMNKPRTALTWFHSPPTTQIGVYNALFPLRVPQANYVGTLKDMQDGGSHGRTWTMLMTAGGHFAGVVVRVCRANSPEPEAKSKHKKSPPLMEVIRHKTFHRYTTRRKQGGAQSANDNRGFAKSAGAQLRRYGEQALQDDIRNLMEEWREDIDASELIWIRASVSNKRIFWDYDEAVFTKRDERIRTFPFPTRRPTQAELTRCINELTYVKSSHFTEDDLRAQEGTYLASLPKPKPVAAPPAPRVTPKIDVPTLSKEEELLRDKWRRVLDMIHKGRLEPLTALWEREGPGLGGVNARVPDWTGERCSTLLQVAAHSGQEEATRWLLEELRADPCIPLGDAASAVGGPHTGNESDGSDAPPPVHAARRTAYDLAANRAIRNVFRRCAWSHPDWWDWHGEGRVASALSKDMEDERDDKKKARRKGLKEKMKEREAREREQAIAMPQPSPVAVIARPLPKDNIGPQKLGGTSGTGDSVAGLSAEMRAKVERERRARAAEARLKTHGSGL